MGIEQKATYSSIIGQLMAELTQAGHLTAWGQQVLANLQQELQLVELMRQAGVRPIRWTRVRRLVNGALESGICDERLNQMQQELGIPGSPRTPRNH